MRALTRRELFDLVWARPVTVVAAELGISDVALHKVCRKHRVPVPGRGYWARKAAGQSPPHALFRKVPDLDRIVIHGSAAQRLPESVRMAQAVEASRADIAAFKADRRMLDDRLELALRFPVRAGAGPRCRG